MKLIKSAAWNLAGIILALGLVAAAAFYGPPQISGPLKAGYRLVYGRLFPCQLPETYSFGTHDERFKISQEEFAAAVLEAEKMWETPIERDLFSRVEVDGALTINLVYDERQAATDKLKALGISLGDDRATYDRLKAQLAKLEVQYNQKKTEYNLALAALKARQVAYEQAVAQWNRSSDQSDEQRYAQLQAEGKAINAEVTRVNNLGVAINALVDQINALVAVINRIAKKLNLAAVNYNDVVKSLGEEFEEGFFRGNDVFGIIDIYEFENHSQLVRVLAHELGHALGLPHLDDPEAIMYRLNSGKNSELTEADVTALKARCGVK